MSVYVGERDIVTAEGPEATKYLQGQLSQDVLALSVGDSAWSLILQPQGKVDAWFRITRSGEDSYLLDVDAGFGEVLLARLQRFKLRTKVDIALATWTLHAYEDVVSDKVVEGRAPIVAPSVFGSGVDVIGPDLGDGPVETVSDEDYRRRRILAGIPAMGAELTEDTIPAEAGVVDVSVSFTKGCYTGQELVARVDSRGNNTPRKLALFRGDGAAAVGDEPMIDDQVVAILTSVANDADGFVALGYLKRSAYEVTAATLDGRPVAVDLRS